MGRTFFLFAKPSFIGGMARVIDLGGTLTVYNNSPTEEEADKKAVHSDWQAVGGDLFNSFLNFEEENALLLNGKKEE